MIIATAIVIPPLVKNMSKTPATYSMPLQPSFFFCRQASKLLFILSGDQLFNCFRSLAILGYMPLLGAFWGLCTLAHPAC